LLGFGPARQKFQKRRTLQIWMTLPTQSGNMSQLYRGFSWISMVANLAGATTVASILSQFDPFARHFASI
jgi:hypothetical protein